MVKLIAGVIKALIVAERSHGPPPLLLCLQAAPKLSRFFVQPCEGLYRSAVLAEERHACATVDIASIIPPNARPRNSPTGPSASAVYLSGDGPESANAFGSAYRPSPNPAWDTAPIVFIVLVSMARPARAVRAQCRDRGSFVCNQAFEGTGAATR